MHMPITHVNCLGIFIYFLITHFRIIWVSISGLIVSEAKGLFLALFFRIFQVLFGPFRKVRKRQKKGGKGRTRPVSRKGGQAPLKPPFVTPPFAAAQQSLLESTIDKPRTLGFGSGSEVLNFVVLHHTGQAGKSSIPRRGGGNLNLVAQCSATPATVAATPPGSATPFQTQISVRHLPAQGGGEVRHQNF